MPKQKLELTWVGKEERARLEPRILLEEPERSYVAPERVDENDLFDNRLIFGDNLLALKALEQEFTGKVKCIFIDPPYNTEQAFEYYDDSLEHSSWLTLIRDRLEFLWRLLSPDGMIAIQIDDSEGAYLQVLMDEVFGRQNRIAIVAIKRSAATGHKAINPGPVNVVDTLLLYAKAKQRWIYKPVKVSRAGYDKAYGTRLRNPTDPFESWTFEGLPGFIARKHGFLTTRAATKALGRNRFDELLVEYALSRPEEIIRFALPDYKGISAAAREYVDRSKENPGVYCLRREHHPDMYFTGGNRILFLKDKVAPDGSGLLEVMTNFWDDISWQGIAGEGGVEFPKGKKPESLIHRILAFSTDPGDLVLDSFAGSGTTGAVAHKMGRRWIMIELGEHCHTHIIPRMQKVIDGTDQGGISKAVGWKGGGGFRYYRLAPTLLMRDKHGRLVINEAYNPEMLAEAMCKHMGFVYQPSQDHYWIHGVRPDSDDRSYLYVTTQHLTGEALASLSEAVGDHRHLAIACCAYDGDAAKRFTNLEVQKIPQAILSKCEFGEDYEERIKKLGWRAPEPEPESPKAAKSREAGQMEMFDEEVAE